MSKKGKSITWETYEYVYREKTADWYWAVSIIAISIAITSILFNNVLFAILILLSFFTLMMYSKRKPSILQIRIDERGIQEGKSKMPYSNIESFWVEDQLVEHKIILKSKNKFLPYTIIPIKDVDPDDVHSHLRQYLPEKEHNEPLAKKIMEYLGF